MKSQSSEKLPWPLRLSVLAAVPAQVRPVLFARGRANRDKVRPARGNHGRVRPARGNHGRGKDGRVKHRRGSSDAHLLNGSPMVGAVHLSPTMGPAIALPCSIRMSESPLDTSVISVGVHDLLRRRGSRQVIDAKVDVSGLATSTAHIPDGTLVDVEVILDSINEGIVLTAEVTVPWVGECRRCLGPAKGINSFEVNEIYRADPLEDMLPIVDEAIDVGAALKDAVILSLPIAPICRDDCAGPSPDDFPILDAEAAAEAKDPRWAALDGLRFDSDDDTD
ncbi:MAG: YceD family protein [Microthrixaceae bacterium]